jgi:gamma-glutamylcyclotransferase (GGCT)/AIG2-like uncharacterized protein YtfP
MKQKQNTKSASAPLYFAYGSNLNRRQFQHRCPKARPFARCQLPDYRLVFDGVADIIPSPGSLVEGALYWITADCERALDLYEGYPNLYTKSYFNVVDDLADPQSPVFEAMFYTMETPDISAPSPSYVRCIHQGFTDWSIPYDSLFAATREANAAPRRFLRPTAAAVRPAEPALRSYAQRDLWSGDFDPAQPHRW